MTEKKDSHIGFQYGLDGIAHKTDAWLTIIHRAIEREGYKTHLEETAYNKKIHYTILVMLPALKAVAKKVMSTDDIDVATGYIAEMALLPVDQFPLAETLARGIRKTKERIGKAKFEYGRSKFKPAVIRDDREKYYSSLEEMFLKAIKTRFSEHNWKTNALHKVRHPLYRGRILRPDLVCENLGLWIEMDGYDAHGNALHFTSDRQRARIAQLEGYYYLSFSGEEISVPGGIENALQFIASFIEKNVGVRSF